MGGPGGPVDEHGYNQKDYDSLKDDVRNKMAAEQLDGLNIDMKQDGTYQYSYADAPFDAKNYSDAYNFEPDRVIITPEPGSRVIITPPPANN